MRFPKTSRRSNKNLVILSLSERIYYQHKLQLQFGRDYRDRTQLQFGRDYRDRHQLQFPKDYRDKLQLQSWRDLLPLTNYRSGFVRRFCRNNNNNSNNNRCFCRNIMIFPASTIASKPQGTKLARIAAAKANAAKAKTAVCTISSNIAVGEIPIQIPLSPISTHIPLSHTVSATISSITSPGGTSGIRSLATPFSVTADISPSNISNIPSSGTPSSITANTIASNTILPASIFSTAAPIRSHPYYYIDWSDTR